jgi:MFS family permease
VAEPKKPSPLLPIFLIVLVDVLGLTIILPLLPFFAEHLGASPFVVGMIVGDYALCQLIAGPIIGRISDKVGRKPMLVFSQLGTFIGFLMLAASSSLWMVFLSRTIDGLTAGNLSLAQAYIADVTEPKDRAKAFGVIGIAFGIGFLIGPATSGWLAGFGFVWPILLAAALSFTSIMATTFLLPGRILPGRAAAKEDVKAPDAGPAGPGGKRLGVLEWSTYAQYFRRRDLAIYLWQFFAFAFMFATFTSGFALFAERRFDWPAQHVEVVRGTKLTFVNEQTDVPFLLQSPGCPELSGSAPPGGRLTVTVPDRIGECRIADEWGLDLKITERPKVAAMTPGEGGAAGAVTEGRIWKLTNKGPRIPFGVRQVGFIFAYVGFLGIILQGGLIGRLVKRFGEVALVQVGFLSAAVGYLLLGETYTVPLLLVVATINSFGSGILRPAITALITQRVDKTEQGVVLGLTQSLMSIAQIAGPLLAGWLIDRRWLVAWACVAGVTALIGAAIKLVAPRTAEPARA